MSKTVGVGSTILADYVTGTIATEGGHPTTTSRLISIDILLHVMPFQVWGYERAKHRICVRWNNEIRNEV